MRKTGCIFIAFMILMIHVYGAEPTDIKDSNYKEAISVLSRLYIVNGDEDGRFKPEEKLTREEYTAYIVRLMGYENIVKSYHNGGLFSDVGADDWSYPYIHLAAEIGIVSGYNDGTFRGKEQITWEDATAILVSAMGYRPVAERNGGYPVGYMIQAGTLKLFDRLKAEAGAGLTRGEAAQLLFNSLEKALFELDSSGNVVSDVSVKDCKTFLSDRLGVAKEEGILSADHFSSITGNRKISEGYVCITSLDGTENTLYALSDEADSGLLGQRITYYLYKETGGNDETVLWMTPSSGRNDVLYLRAEDISDCATLTDLVYYEGDKTLKADVDLSAAVLYNGAIDQPATGEIITPAFGGIKLIDNTGDGNYDVLMIDDELSCVVDSVNEQNQYIYLKQNGYNKSIIDVGENDDALLVTKDGVNIKYTELKEGDALSVGESKDKSKLSITVSDKTVEGEITQISDDAKHQTVTIEGNVYVVTDGVYNTLNVGDKGKFYILRGNEIAYADVSDESAGHYAYMLNAQAKGDIGEDVEIKLLTKDGAITIFELAPRVKVYQANNMTSSLTPTQFMAQLTQKEQLIVYDQSSEGKINEVRFAVDCTTIPDYKGYTENVFTKDMSADLYFKLVNPPTLGGEYILTNDTVVFDVSKYTPDEKELTEEDYYAGNYSVFGKDKTYRVQIYNATPSKKAGAVVITADLSNKGESVPWSSSAMLVDKFSQTVNDDGDQVLMVSGFLDGQQVKYPAKDNDVMEEDSGTKLNELPRGSVIQIKLNMKKEIDSIRILFIPNDSKYKREYVGSGSGALIDLYTIFGTTVVKEPDVLTVSTGGATSKPFAIDKVNVYSYNLKTNTAKIASYADIVAAQNTSEGASSVFLRVNRNVVGEIIIMNE